MTGNHVWALILAVGALAACAPNDMRAENGQSGHPPPPGEGDPILTVEDYRTELVAEGLETPWAMQFDRNGRLFLTERPGRVRVIVDGRLDPNPVAVIEDSTETGGEGGLMGLALHPDFHENGWMYLAYTRGSRGNFEVVVARYTYRDGGLSNRLEIVSGIEGGANHNGCALGFGPDGMLYVTTGERFRGQLSQDLGSLNGKTLRVTESGEIPPDNPFVDRPGARPEIFSYGHRNAQGIAWQPGTNLMFQTEHGPSSSDGPAGGDEINVVRAGLNYGWPEISHDQTREGMVSPLVQYTPAEAPAACAFYTGSEFPVWKHNLFFTALRGQGLHRVVLEEDRVLFAEKLFSGEFGRLRAIAVGADGYIYFGTSNRDGRGQPRAGDDRIFRLMPRE